MHAYDVATRALHDAVIGEVRRRLVNESVPRLKKCLGLLSEQEVWRRPNDSTVSVGNLILHLCGNLRQWVLSGLGNAPDWRARQSEFDEPGPIPTVQLVAALDQVMNDVERLLERLSPDDLLTEHTVQGFRETGVAVLIHVVEHFSYHVGQISWSVKVLKDIDLGYYDGVDLDATGPEKRS